MFLFIPKLGMDLTSEVNSLKKKTNFGKKECFYVERWKFLTQIFSHNECSNIALCCIIKISKITSEHVTFAEIQVEFTVLFTIKDANRKNTVTCPDSA